MIRQSLKLLKRALRSNLLPAFCVWLVGLSIVASYYNVEVVRVWLDKVEILRDRLGLLFPMLVVGLFWGLLPLLTQYVFLPGERGSFGRRVRWIVPFWVYKGLEVETFYNLQSLMWGADNAATTVFAKICTDMFLYTPILGLLNVVLFLRLLARRNGEQPRDVPFFPRNWYRQLMLPTLILNWMVWIPALCFVYSMPLPLQLPVANIVGWLWSMILIFISKDESHQESPVPGSLSPSAAARSGSRC